MLSGTVRCAFPPRLLAGECEDEQVITFVDDDGGYLRWLTSNIDGFIVNADRKPTPAYLRLHRASCPMIQGRPANGARWTVTSIKVCGSIGELEAWARDVVGGDLRPCPQCV